ncbi:insulinase family protein, partial [Candidatus Wolfebacteria bacterium]|nr:insulinase family protein [Candidatus Wolfebacteria bacterium]
NILDVIADVYLNSIFDANEIEKEKGVIIEEINMYEDMPMRKVNDIFTDLLYKDQPAGWDIAGERDVIKSLTREDIVNYRKKHYVAQATTVVVAGAFDEKKIVKKIEKLFKDMPTTKKYGKKKTLDKQSKPAVSVKFKKSDQSHIVLGFRSFDMYDKRKTALSILGDILGGGMSSRLFQEVRDKLGAAYYVRAGADLFTDHGFFAVSAGLDNARTEQVVKAILKELRRISTELVTEEELNRSKNHFIGHLMIGLETSDELANFYGEQELFKKEIHTPKDLIKRVKEVTAKDVLKVAKDIIKNKNLNLAVIGPIKDKKKLEKILKL